MPYITTTQIRLRFSSGVWVALSTPPTLALQPGDYLLLPGYSLTVALDKQTPSGCIEVSAGYPINGPFEVLRSSIIWEEDTSRVNPNQWRIVDENGSLVCPSVKFLVPLGRPPVNTPDELEPASRFSIILDESDLGS